MMIKAVAKDEWSVRNMRRISARAASFADGSKRPEHSEVEEQRRALARRNFALTKMGAK